MLIEDVKTAMRERALVEYKGVVYERITACIMRIDASNRFVYSLELLDRCGSAVVVAPIDEVEVAHKETP